MKKIAILSLLILGISLSHAQERLRARAYGITIGVLPTGTLNAITLEKMGITLAYAQKGNVAAQTAYDEANKN